MKSFCDDMSPQKMKYLQRQMLLQITSSLITTIVAVSLSEGERGAERLGGERWVVTRYGHEELRRIRGKGEEKRES